MLKSIIPLPQEYSGRTLRVNFSDKPRAKEPLYPETEYKLFVGNLSWSATSESLTKAFQEYGNVVGARVLYDGETGRSRGYGFVCFSTKSEMETALQSLDGVVLFPSLIHLASSTHLYMHVEMISFEIVSSKHNMLMMSDSEFGLNVYSTFIVG